MVLSASGRIDKLDLPRGRIAGNSHFITMDRNIDGVRKMASAWRALASQPSETHSILEIQ